MSVFLLGACGSGNELEDFTEAFNNRAISENVPELIPEEFGEMEEYEGETWRELYESEKYHIEANYEGGKNLIGYSIVIDPEDSFRDKEGVGYEASKMVARALGLSVDEYVNNFEKALKTDIHSYSESGYEIRFVYIGWNSSIPTSIIINFDKK